MSDQLIFDTAKLLAERLTAIPGFPWRDSVITAHAEHLVRWCKGAIIDGFRYSAEVQAEWLVTDAQVQWDKWLGTAALFQMFQKKFGKTKTESAVPGLAYDEAVTLGLIRGPCRVCGDALYTGVPPNLQYCTACQGGRHAQSWYGNRDLERLNREVEAHEPKFAGGLQPFTPITQEQIEEAIRDARRRKEKQNGGPN